MRIFKSSLLPMLITCCVAGSVLTILAPYGTHDFPIIFRAFYWIGLCLVGGFAIVVTNWGIGRLDLTFQPFVLALVHSVTSALGVFAVLLGMTVLKYHMPGAGELIILLFYVWVIAFTISLVGMLMSRSSAEEETPVLYQRLKPALRSAKIYALSAEDHYVRVITDKGEDLILMRLSDAIKEISPLTGLSPHRSWWVAEQGVEEAKSKSVILRSGQSVPVSRNGLKAVKAAGWA